MAVTFFSSKEQNLTLEREFNGVLSRLLRSGQFILGPEVEALEQQLSQYLGGCHAITVSSGTDAILLALMSLGVGPGDEVICPSFTFFATAGCVSRLGATPVFADVCPVCCNINPRLLEAKLTPRTKGIIPVHLFGQSAAMEPIMKLARERSLWVIEDAAQSVGAEYGGRKVGLIGDFGAFSFYPTKNLGALGDAGLLVTRNDEQAARARVLRNHGMDPKYYYRWIGANFRMDALQAGFLSLKLGRLQDYNLRRAENASYYQRRLAGIPGAVMAATHCCGARVESTGPADWPKLDSLVIPSEAASGAHTWNQFTIRVPGNGRRDGLRAYLQSRRIGSEVYYPVPLHKQECFRGLPSKDAELPVSELLAREVLSLPVYPELTRGDLDEVVGAIGDYLVSE